MILEYDDRVVEVTITPDPDSLPPDFNGHFELIIRVLSGRKFTEEDAAALVRMVKERVKLRKWDAVREEEGSP